MRLVYLLITFLVTINLGCATSSCLWWDKESPKLEHTHFKTIDSTQTHALKTLAEKPLDPSCVHLFTADEQTAGIGSGSRRWESPKGNLYATFVFPWSMEHIMLAPLVPQIAALSVCETLEKFGLRPQLKWVNDILLGGNKSGGVLCQFESDAMLVGIGINVNTDDRVAAEGLAASTDDPMRIPFGSMKIASRGTEFPIDEVLEILKTQLTRNLAQLIAKKGFVSFYPRVDTRLAYKGKWVMYTEDCKGSISRKIKVLGINESGHLKFEEVDGTKKEACFGRICPTEE